MFNEIHLDAPQVGELEKDYLSRAIDTGYVSTAGPYVALFEEKIASLVGAKGAVSTQSGTSALHVCLHELGIGAGDEVIVPALTFVATVNPVIYAGACPVFADVDLRTWNIDPVSVQNCVTDRTKAIIPVHLYGNPCDMNVIKEIASKYGLYVIEDATESLGAKFNGEYIGTIGHLGCLSFNGNKTITTGGGGMVLGNDEKRLGHIKFLVNQARDESRGYFHSEVGFNYRMTNLEAAVGLAQLERLDGFLRKKRSFNAIYREELGGLDCLRFQEEQDGGESSWWLTSVFFEKEMDIPRIQKGLRERGVPTRRVFMPVPGMPPYVGHRCDKFENAEEIYDRGLCLPSSTLNSYDDIRNVCEIMKEAIAAS